LVHLEELAWLIHPVAAAAIEAKSSVALGVAFPAPGSQLLVGKCISGSKFHAHVAGEELVISEIISNWKIG
jgi:hypothetical protein